MAGDTRWLIMAVIFFMSIGGPWRILTRLRDAIAFGYLDQSVERLCSRIQRYRLMSLLGLVGMFVAYWIRYPFPLNAWVWWGAGIWVLFSINLIGEGMRVLERIEKK